MSCDNCGRDDGHWIGCARAVDETHTFTEAELKEGVAAIENAAQCAREGCSNPRAPQGKGPRPKYCDEHKIGSKK